MRTFRKFVNGPIGSLITTLVIASSVYSFSDPYNYLYALEVERAKEAQIREIARKMNVDAELLLNPQGRRSFDFKSLFDWVSNALGFQAASTVAASEPSTDQPEDVKAQIARVKSRYALVAADTTLAKLAELLEVSLSPENVREKKKGQIKAELRSVLRLIEQDFLPKPIDGLSGSALSRDAQMRVALGKLRQDVKGVINAPHALDEKNIDATLAKLRDTIGGSLKLKNNGQPRWTKDPFPVKDSYKQAQKTSTGPRYGDAAGTTSDANATTPAVVANAAAPATNAPRVMSNAVSSDVAALAAQLATPAKAFGFVYDNVDFEAYSGVAKGARGALLERRGNDWDQALLLRDLLIAQGYQAQIEWGKVELPIARAMNLVGTEDPLQAANLLATAGYDSVALTQNGTPIVVRMTHAWVRAFIPYIPNRGTTGGTPDTWVRMDPSFKRYEYQAGLDINVPWNENEYLQTSAVRPPNDFYADKVWAYIRANNLNCNNLAQVPKTGRVKAANFPFVPATLNARVESLSGLAAQPPASMMQTVSISVTDPYFGDSLASYSANFADLWGKKLSIAFPPATADDAATIARYGGIYNTPAYLVRLKAVISIDDVPVAEGGSVAAGADLGLDLSFREPNLGTDYSHHEITAGETMTEVFDTGRTPDALVAERMERLKAIAAQPAGEARDTALLTEKLSLVGMRYFQHVDDSFDFATGTRWHRWVKSTFEGLVSQRVTTMYNFVGQAVRIAPGDRNIDVTRLVVGIIPIQSDTSERLNTMALAGLQTSYLEGSIWEEMEAQQGISATKALLLSRMAGQTIRTADRSNVEAVLAAINLSAQTESNIRGAVNQGRIAIVPSANIRLNKWVGTGYILRDPIGGSATYPISGGFAGGSSTGGGLPPMPDTLGDEPWMGSLDAMMAQLDALLGNVRSGVPSAMQSDPVNITSGNFYRETTDISVAARGIPMRLSRTYNSRSSQSGPFGYGWTFTYGESITPLPNGALLYRDGDGTEHTFQKAATGQFISPPGKHIELTAGAGGYEMEMNTGVRYRFDGQGLLVEIVDLNGNTLTIQRDAAGMPASIIDAAGRTILTFTVANGHIVEVGDVLQRKVRYEYDGDDLIAVTDLGGGVTRFAYDGAHNMTEVTDPMGGTQSFDYDVEDRVFHHVDAMGAEEYFHYDAGNRQAVLTDRRGGDRLIGFDARGRATSEADPAGNVVRAAFDADDNRTQVVDSRGYATHFEFDADGNMTRQVNADGGTIVVTYDENAHVLTHTSETGAVTTNSYDSSGNLTASARVADGLADTRTMTYDGNGQVLTVIESSGGTTTYTWSENGMPLTQTDPLNATTTYATDAAGRVLSVTDAQSNRTTFAYDGADRLVTLVDANGVTASTTYDLAGRRIALQTPAGTTTYAYDAEGRLISTTDPAGKKSTTTYNAAGDVMAQTDARGSVTRYEYDGAGRVTKMTDANGGVWTFDYCAGLGTSGCGCSTGSDATYCEIIDPSGQRMKREFDSMGRVVTMTDSLANSVRIAYDHAGRKLTETDANGHTKKFTYDAAGRLLRVEEANGAVTSYTYDARGNRLTQKDANGRIKSFQYDLLNRVSEEADPLGRKTTYTYDLSGNVKTQTDGNGRTTTYQYDGRRLAKVVYHDGTSDAFTYDASGRRNGAVNPNAAMAYTYDSLGRVLSSTNQTLNLSVSYQYDALGNRTKMTTPQSTVDYVYDAKNRLTTMKDSLFGEFRFEYDAMDRRTSLRYPNGITTSYAYDEAYRMTGVVSKNTAGTVVDAWTYQYDGVGNRTAKVDMTGRAETYQYDAADRVVSAEYGDGSFERFSYDPVGNRLSLTTESATVTYAYDVANQMVRSGDDTLSYDGNGNLTKRTSTRGTTNYGYDLANRLATVNGPDGTETNLYGPDGGRVDFAGTAIESGRVRILYDRQGNPILDWGNDNRTWTYRLYGPGIDEPLAEWRRPNNRFTYLLRDGGNSITAVTAADGTVAYRQSYKVFGKISRTADATGLPSTRLGFTGRENSVGNLMYYRARHYDTSEGRFLQQDPYTGDIAAPPSLQRYVYTLNNPIKYVDPDGRHPLLAVGGALVTAAILIQTFLLGYMIGIVIRRNIGGPDIMPEEYEIGRILFFAAIALIVLAGAIFLMGPGILMGGIWTVVFAAVLIGYIGWCALGFLGSGRRIPICIANIWCAVAALRSGFPQGVMDCIRRNPSSGMM